MRTQTTLPSMGMIKRLSVLMIILCCAFASAFAQQLTITGTVTDDMDEPLPGVSIVIKGQKNGVMTDIDGNYTTLAAANAEITFSYVGMKAQTVKVNGRTKIDIVMMPDANSLDEFVAVGYGVQKRGTITGAVSTVQGAELLNVPTMSISNIIGGRVAGISTKQSSGQPGSDNASISLRGQYNIIYVIDGVKRTSEDFNQLDPNEIESVSILKDAASVAIYGLDANGVIIVSTKRGKNEKTHISYTGSVGISQNAENQEWLDGPGYAYWFNKALEMDGQSPIFTAAHVQKMRLGIDGWGNTNWYKEIFGTGIRTSHNVSASGGGERVQFFTALSYLNENGNVDKFGFNRWNIRSNVDAKIANGLKLSVGISGRMQHQDNPYYSANPDAFYNVGSQMVRMLPYLPKTMTGSNGKEYYVANLSNPGFVSVLSSINDSGYTQYDYNNIGTTMTLQWDTPFLEGLSAKFTAAYDANFNFSKQLNNPGYVMRYENRADKFVAPDVLTYTLQRNCDVQNIQLNEGASKSSTFTTLTSLSYNNRFGVHSINAIALAETREYKTNNLAAYGYGLPFISLDILNQINNTTFDGENKYPSIGGSMSMSRIAGFAARANYNYDDKYFVEASVRRDGSYLFGGMNKRWITLPGVSAGWRIDREDFFNADWVNNLKIRLGFGQTATSGIAPFAWRNTMGVSKNGVVIGGTSSSFISAGMLGNPTLTWSKCDNYNLGVDANLWNGLLNMEFDVFYKYEYDQLTKATNHNPPSMGGYDYEYANLNKKDYKGFDITLTHNNRIGNVDYGVKFIWSYAYSRWLYVASDSPNAPDYQRLTGKQVGSKIGLLAAGLFQTEQEILEAPSQTSISPKGTLPGQIRYIDRNGDGKISYMDDYGYVGKSDMPTHTGSLNLTANWNGFDVDIFFVCGLGHEVAMTGVYTSSGSEGVQDGSSYTVPFKWFGNSPVYLVENSWTPDNTNAQLPRLCAVPQNNNDAYASTFWYRNANYLRFKSAQIGYTIPHKLIRKAGITKLRVYAEGYNLFTWSGLSNFNIDPESPAVNNGYYPQQRKISFGLNLSF